MEEGGIFFVGEYKKRIVFRELKLWVGRGILGKSDPCEISKANFSKSKKNTLSEEEQKRDKILFGLLIWWFRN